MKRHGKLKAHELGLVGQIVIISRQQENEADGSRHEKEVAKEEREKEAEIVRLFRSQPIEIFDEHTIQDANEAKVERGNDENGQMKRVNSRWQVVDLGETEKGEQAERQLVEVADRLEQSVSLRLTNALRFEEIEVATKRFEVDEQFEEKRHKYESGDPAKVNDLELVEHFEDGDDEYGSKQIVEKQIE